MKTLLQRLAIALTALCFTAGAAFAQASFTFKDAAGVTQTAKSINCTSTVCPASVPIDSTGTAFGTTGNPFFFNVASGGIASGAIASGAFASGSIGSGAMVDLGAIADAAATAGSTGTLSAKLRLITTQLATLNTTLGSPFQAGASIGNTTFASTQSGNWTARSVGNLGAAFDFAGQDAGSPANSIQVGGQFNTTPTTIANGKSSPLQMDSAGNLLSAISQGGNIAAVKAASAAAAQTDPAVVTRSADLGTTADSATCTASTVIACLKQIDADVKAAPPLATTGGMTTLKLAALSNTAVAIKGSAGQLYKLYCANSDTTHWAYVQVYNVVSGSVTVGTTASIPYGIAPNSTGGFQASLIGDQFATAISAAATSTATGGSAPTTALDCNVSYN